MNENKPIISERIKNLRKEKGITQEQLAEILGLNAKSSIANYESGANSPSDEVKKKMCDFFGCSMDYLMGLSSHVNPKEELENELSKFNLTEDEYYDAINCFMSNDINGLSFIILFANESDVKTKEYKVLLTILSYVSDYIANIHLPNDKTSIDPMVRGKFERELERAYSPAKRLLLSLDKSKIIHNYNINTHERDFIADTPEVRAIARDVAKLKPEKKELFKNLLKQMSDEADEANKE